jgi:hypothetical protein
MAIVVLVGDFMVIVVAVVLMVTRGGGRTGGHGDKKCDHCGGKPNYVHQVIDGTAQSQPTSTSSGHIHSGSNSRDALTTQLSKLVRRLCTALLSSTATLADSGNVACLVNSSPSWVIDSSANKHIYGILSLLFDLTC